MSTSRFAEQLNTQIGNEFAAHQQYVAIAVHYDADALPQLAGLFYRQSVEERNHAMIMVQYLLDADEPVVIPGVDAPQATFGGLIEPVALALEQEKRVSDQCAFFLASQGTPGVIVEHGDTSEMFDNPQDQRTRDYVQGRFG